MPVYRGDGVPLNESRPSPQKGYVDFVRSHSPSRAVRERSRRDRRVAAQFPWGMFLFLLCAIAAGVLLVQWLTPPKQPTQPVNRALKTPSPPKVNPTESTEDYLRFRLLKDLASAIERQDMRAAVPLWNKAREIREGLGWICMATRRKYDYLNSAMWLLTGKFRNFKRLRGRVTGYYHNGGTTTTAWLTIKMRSKKITYTVSDWTVHYSTAEKCIVPRDYKNLIGKKVEVIYDRPRHYGPDDGRILVVLYRGQTASAKPGKLLSTANSLMGNPRNKVELH